MITAEQLANRRTWVAALTSGDIPQATGCLAMVGDGTVIGYCCLGVAAERFETIKRVEEEAVAYGESPTISTLPLHTRRALGLLTESPWVVWQGRAVSLVNLNDLYHFTLPQIGAIIAMQPASWDGLPIGVPSWGGTPPEDFPQFRDAA